jgi:ADP-ribosylglycohydrolase
MLWAAWADALGFISELTNDAGLRRRLQGKPLTEPVQWTRRIGGKFGVDMTLPAGCYSDDTQLRLATARAVHGAGFDVEAFARIELAIWPSYALGGGRATKAAAAQMAKPGTPWFGNLYGGWLDAGGNGVAMRIQPHVWAAPHPAVLGQHILDVIVNGVTSHGHSRALVGAVLHALSLGFAMENGRVPQADRWPELADLTDQAVKLISNNQQLDTLWRPTWESRTGVPFVKAWRETIGECRNVLPLAAETAAQLSDGEGHLAKDAATTYARFVDALHLRDPAKRGNAITTVIAAMTLAAAAPADPIGVSRLAVNFIGTDTDTIATMAAALIGASDDAPEPQPVLDTPYLTTEAARLAAIASGQPTVSFSYPDLLHWVPPHAQLDAVGLAGTLPAIAGLGWLELAEGNERRESRDAIWEWMRSDFGASFLIKRRPELRQLPEAQWPIRRKITIEPSAGHADQDIPAGQLPLYDDEPMRPHHAETTQQPSEPRLSRQAREPRLARDQVDIDQVMHWLARRGFSDEDIGYAIRRISESGTMEQLLVFTSTLRSALHK